MIEGEVSPECLLYCFNITAYRSCERTSLKWRQNARGALHLQNAGKASANSRSGVQKGPPACETQFEGVLLDFMTYSRDTRYPAMPFLAYFRWNVSQAMLAV
jgi:hypothetical protein